MNELVILADNYRLACHWARENELGPERRGVWRYVNRVDQAFGLRNGRYVVVTLGERSWAQLEERWEIEDVLKAHGFTKEVR